MQPMRAPRCLGSAAMRGQRLGGGAEQEIVDGGLVLEGDLGDRRRQGEDDVVIGDRQQIGLALGEPLRAPPRPDTSGSAGCGRSCRRRVHARSLRSARRVRRARLCDRLRSPT